VCWNGGYIKRKKRFKRGNIYRQTKRLEHEVIELNFPDLSDSLTTLSKEQRKYLGRRY